MPTLDTWGAMMKHAGAVAGGATAAPAAQSAAPPLPPAAALGDLLGDGLHLSAAGNALLAELVMQTIESLLPQWMPEAGGATRWGAAGAS